MKKVLYPHPHAWLKTKVHGVVYRVCKKCYKVQRLYLIAKFEDGVVVPDEYWGDLDI